MFVVSKPTHFGASFSGFGGGGSGGGSVVGGVVGGGAGGVVGVGGGVGGGATTSCQSEYNGRAESAAEAKKSIAGLKGSLRRNSSSLSKDLSNLEICHADATQVEIDCKSIVDRSFYVRVECPTGEVGEMHFSTAEAIQSFTPIQHGCGHGIWKFRVCTLDNGCETTHSAISKNLDGVGIIFFNVFDDLEIRVDRQEFLHIGHCHTRRH